MGLAVDEDGADSPSPPPLALTPPPVLGPHIYHPLPHHQQLMAANQWNTSVGPLNAVAMYSQSSRKRQFDVASLLAPDDESNYGKSTQKRMAVIPHSSPSPPSYLHQAAGHPINCNNSSDLEEDIDVVANDDQTNQNQNQTVIDRDRNVNGVTPSPPAQETGTTQSEENTGDQQYQERQIGGSWNSLIQQLPMDPRILGRYYGQYMAAAQQRVANKRLNNSPERHSASPTNAKSNSE
jgi:hypothetical protein